MWHYNSFHSWLLCAPEMLSNVLFIYLFRIGNFNKIPIPALRFVVGKL